nr:unnamed protein product [Spirometra erinaceieuropaei]
MWTKLNVNWFGVKADNLSTAILADKADACPLQLTSDGKTGSSLGTLKANSFVLDFRSNLPFFVNLGRTASQKGGYAAATSNVSRGAEISNLAPRDQQLSTRSHNPSLNSILWPLEVFFRMQLQD